MDWSWIDDEDDITEDDNDDDDEDFNDDNEDDNYRVFFHWASPKKLKYGKMAPLALVANLATRWHWFKI